jgi:DNA-binding winged helix-turn-helix (wHTH) protein
LEGFHQSSSSSGGEFARILRRCCHCLRVGDDVSVVPVLSSFVEDMVQAAIQAEDGIQAMVNGTASQKGLNTRYARFGPFAVDLQQRAVYKNGVDLGLCGGKYELLCAFIERGDRLVSRNELCDRLWQSCEQRQSEQLNGLVLALRRVLGVDFNEQPYIETVRGKGYKLVDLIEFSDEPPASSLSVAELPSKTRVLDADRYIRFWRQVALFAGAFSIIVWLIVIALMRSVRLESGLGLIFLSGILFAGISSVSAYIVKRMSTKHPALPD